MKQHAPKTVRREKNVESSVNKEKLPSDIVYVYNYKDLIRIQRTRGGEWSFYYTIKTIADHINDTTKRENVNWKRSDLIHYCCNEDMFNLGLAIGAKAELLITRCQKSYGDE